MKLTNLIIIIFLTIAAASCSTGKKDILAEDNYRHYIDDFNNEEELHLDVIPGTTMIPDSLAWDFLRINIPFMECPDKDIEEIYYYRWWTFRKHLKKTEGGYVITEFMPKVGWAGKYNTISCAAGHHIREARWLHNPEYAWDYSLFWLRGGGNPYTYTFWISDSFLQLQMVHPHDSLLYVILPDLVTNFRNWEKRRRTGKGLFWQADGEDGMEVSISGSGKRPTINSAMFADARAIATIARMKGDKKTESDFISEYDRIRSMVLDTLWDKKARFFKVLPVRGYQNDSLSSARELLGYTPWYAELPPQGKGYEVAWNVLNDPKGFNAPFGPTTAEQSHPGFRVSYEGHECQWNGPSWPYATSQTLTAMLNVLNDYDQDVISKDDFFQLLKTYTRSHRFRQIPPSGDTIITDRPWIDENLNPFNGDWLARTRMEVQGHNHGYRERGIYYNHSTYNDIIITGLAGIRPSTGNTLVVNPMIPVSWDWFCLDKVLYKGHMLTILWDKTGQKYHVGKGLHVYSDGRLMAKRSKIQKLSIRFKDLEN